VIAKLLGDGVETAEVCRGVTVRHYGSDGKAYIKRRVRPAQGSCA
jgi:hypothetical protein